MSDSMELRKLTEHAEDGIIEAQYILGKAYLEGIRGCEKNNERAVMWMKTAAINGHSWAQYDLAELYAKGDCVKRDLSKSFEWFKRSARQGNELAFYRVARCYQYGIGVKKDDKKAIEWYKIGQSDPKCILALGMAYERGTGIERNLKKALFYYEKISVGKYKSISKRLIERLERQQEDQVQTVGD